jgi:hypothetical protein
MARTYDVEVFLSNIETILKNNLNSKLASIDTEKNDGITLKTLVSDAYFFQELNSKVANYNPFLLYGVEDLGTKAVEGFSVQEVTVSIVIVVTDDGEDQNIAKRMLRYSRALQEVFEENFCLVENSVKLIIQNLMPVEFNMLNSSDSYRAVGINLIASLP